MNESPKPPVRSEKEIFFDALERTNSAERAGYVDGACGSDLALRARVQVLLANHFSQDSFMEPAVAPASELAGQTVTVAVTEKPGDRIGRYKLLQQIGEGGCGVVYMAEQEEPVHRRVALKVIKLGMDTKSVIARFEAERQALALMDHPNVAKVLDAGATDAGRPYFVMELVRGIKITEYCDQHNLSTGARLQLFVQVCHAIQHAHQKGIIHRDIKPSNILVTLHDGVPVPKVIDFGIAKATEQKLTDKTLFTAFEQFIGTPAYTSPEQAEMSGLDIDTRSDIYSLGVLLYELLTGKTPFDAKELMAAGLEEMRRTIREKEPVRPSTRLSTMLEGDLTKVATHRQSDAPKLVHLVRGDLDWIVMTCLEKDRTRRYDTANGLALDIERHLNDEPVVARPPTAAYRFQKLVRRNRLAFAAATVVALTLLLAAVVSSWQAQVATRARKAAETARANETSQRIAAQAAQSQADEQRRRAEHQLYAANVNLMRQAWEENHVERMLQLLKETAAYADRGFEWYYWQRQAHLELMMLNGHSEWVWSAAFSPDGRRIVTGSHDRIAKVWDAASGKELLILKGHHGAIDPAAFSSDGRRIVTGSMDGTARLWDAASGEALLTLEGHTGGIYSAAFSPDGRRIATGSADSTARVWDAASGKEQLIFKGHGEWISATPLSAEGTVFSVAFSPDGRWLATAGGDLTARLWDAGSGEPLRTFKGHDRALWSVAFSPDGLRVLTGSADGTARLWDAASGKELLILKGHRGMIYSVGFSLDGRKIITGSYDHTAKVWDAVSGNELLTFKGHSAGVSAAAFSPDGQRIITSSGDLTAKIWDAARGDEPLTLKAHGSGVNSVAFSPDDRRIVTGSGDRTAKVWEVANGKEVLTLKGHCNDVTSVAFSPDGRRIVTGSEDRVAKVWDAASGSELLALNGHSSQVWSVGFSPDGQWIVTGSKDATAKLWDATGKERRTFKGHGSDVTSVVFSPDGQRLVTGCGDGTVKVWEVASGRELSTFKCHGNVISSMAFSPDGRRIVTGSWDWTAKVWDAASGTELFVLRGHRAWVLGVAFSPDGQRIVTTSDDQMVKLWKAATGKELLSLNGHGGPVASAAFSHGGQRIVTGSYDRTAKVWEAATPKQVVAWQSAEKDALERREASQRQQVAATEQERVLRAKDPGAIKQWLVLAPISIEGRTSGQALEQDQVPQEARLHPKADERVKVGERDLVWKAVQLEDVLIDFSQVVGQVTSSNVAYAVCYIQSETDQAGVTVKVGSDDHARIYLNGKDVYHHSGQRACYPDQDSVAGLELRAGFNVLVFKVVNETGDWRGSVRFTDAAGQPLKGIKVGQEPEKL